MELAIKTIEAKGIDKKEILAITMYKKAESVKLFDSIHSSDGLSLFDLPCIIGSIYGFILTWGPILWGLIGFVLGFSVGFIIKLFIVKNLVTGEKAIKQLTLCS